MNGVPDADWEAYLEEGWDRERTAAVASRFPELVMQQVSEQRAHKVSYKLYAADGAQATGLVSNLRSQLAAAGLDTNVVFSGGQDLDILPARASKGKALAFLLKQFEETVGAPPSTGVMVCGDSGNDVELFEVAGVRGCMVANAHNELKDWCDANASEMIFKATEDGPGGIVQALHHFNFIPGSGGGGGVGGQETAASVVEKCVGRRRAVVELHEWFEAYFVADPLTLLLLGGERNEDLAVLESTLAPNFELIGPSGVLTSRTDLLKWFRVKGRGSRNPGSKVSGDPLAPSLSETSQGLLSAAIASADTPSTPTGIDPGSPGAGDSGRFRIWIDSFSERELSPGLWLVRYKEVQQRFPAVSATGRTTRWSTALLREEEREEEEEEEEEGGGGSVRTVLKWEYVHETWAPNVNGGATSSASPASSAPPSRQ